MKWMRALENLSFSERELVEVCRYLRYSVEARAGYALVEALEQGVKPEELGAGGEKNCFGIILPIFSLRKHMYVPRPVIKADLWEKRHDPYNGITLFAIDQLNLFVTGTEYCAKELVEQVILQRVSGRQLLERLQRERGFKERAKEYSRQLLRRAQLDILYEAQTSKPFHPHLPELALRLTEAYAREMGLEPIPLGIR